MKSQRGTGMIESILMLLIAGVLIYNYIYVPFHNERIISERRSESQPVTAEDVELVINFKNKAEPKLIVPSTYLTKYEIDGKEAVIKLVFHHNGSVTKELTIDGRWSMSGNAAYYFEGGVIRYNNISGDRYLFPEIGEPVSYDEANDRLALHFSDVPTWFLSQAEYRRNSQVDISPQMNSG